ncbi:MAG: translation initiation factor IF-3 [Bacteroidaceae bacterium]|nr:translation initiation factor IF-3 [Bacteroidaceae bacterium]MBP5731957.1 translation initiation factor IF-3 [Bacteroidaceae bacterium]
MKNDRAKQQYRINEQIRAREVRVVGDGIESEVMPTRDAIDLARSMDQDLVEISPTAVPPVCRVIDYSKFLYQQKKKQKEMKARQVKISVKEIRFGPQTDEHDYDFKLKHAKEFLEAGNKVKAYVFFRGRSIVFKEQGEVLLLRFANDLEEVGKVEQMPSLLGKRMIMFLAPKKMPTAAKKAVAADEVPAKKNQSTGKPEQKARKEYTGPKVEGENFDD